MLPVPISFMRVNKTSLHKERRKKKYDRDISAHVKNAINIFSA